MTSKTYRVAATKSGKYWHLDIEDMPQGTQVRRLSEAEETAADLINIFTEAHLNEIAIDLRMQLPDDVATIRAEAQQLFEQAKASNALAAEKSREAAKLLKAQGLTLKEIGQALDVSYQRVAQLIAS